MVTYANSWWFFQLWEFLTTLSSRWQFIATYCDLWHSYWGLKCQQCNGSREGWQSKGLKGLHSYWGLGQIRRAFGNCFPVYGNLWRFIANVCNFRDVLAPFGRIWQFSVTYGYLWHSYIGLESQYCMETGRANKSVSAWGARTAIAAWKPKPKAKQFLSKQLEAWGNFWECFYNYWKLIAVFGNWWRFMTQICRHAEPTLQWKPGNQLRPGGLAQLLRLGSQHWKRSNFVKLWQLVVVYGSLWQLIEQLLMPWRVCATAT